MFDYIESMFNVWDECVNIYEEGNGNIVLTYEWMEQNDTMKRYFNSYDEAVNYLYKNGYTW